MSTCARAGCSAPPCTNCNRAGYYEQGEFALTYDLPKCLVKLGCAGQVVKCNVPKRGWINGVGGCPNAGGICIGCTMPSFPDMFMPFMEQLPLTWRGVSTPYPGSPASAAESESYGAVIRQLREFALKKFDTEPGWRARPAPKPGPGRLRSAREAITGWWHHRGG